MKTKVVGICPCCYSDLYVLRSSNRKRYVKCGNECCSGKIGVEEEVEPTADHFSFSYPLPKSGKLETTGCDCEKHELPILAIHKGKPKNTTYFWVQGPCFVCVDRPKCEIIDELEDEF